MSDMKQRMFEQAERAAQGSLRRTQERSARLQSIEADTDVLLAIQAIIADPEIQVRIGGLSEQKVESYLEALNAGAEFPAVDVCRDGERYYLAHGFHRYEAHVRAGKTDILANIMPGGRAGAIEQAEEGNLRHGLELTMNDKKYIFVRRMDRGHWNNSDTSLRDIAKAFGVNASTISRWRREFEEKVYSDEGVASATPAEEYGKPEKASPRKKGGRKPAKKRAPTPLQLRQRALKNLRAAADAFDLLDMAQQARWTREFADEMAAEWKM